MYKILLLTPFRNEAHSIPYYLRSLEELKYPHNLIDLYWLENDSSDDTLNILREAIDGIAKMSFNSVKLYSANIIGKVPKRLSTDYIKDIPYGSGRLKSWLAIWNDYFLPVIRMSDADYVLAYYADCICPPNTIDEYLKVYQQFPDAGWVGGTIYRRYPQHNLITSPRADASLGISYTYLQEHKEPVRMKYVGHVWLMPRQALTNCKFVHAHIEMHYSLIGGLAQQKRYVYWQPSVYLKHISMDGQYHKPDEE